MYFSPLIGQVLGNAPAGLHSFNVELGSLGADLLETAVLIMGILIISHIGGSIEKPLRSGFPVLLIGALFFKAYTSIATGAMGLF